jgi:hypothetical protein
MSLHDLDDLINGLGIDPTPEQLAQLYKVFKSDFIDRELEIGGLKVKIILSNSKVDGYTQYPETFVHLITRKSIGGKRVFDRHRANKLHWVRCILENRNEAEISYFESMDSHGVIKDHFWFVDGYFLVIMKKVAPDYLIISSFHIDNDKNRKYFEGKLRRYQRGIK